MSREYKAKLGMRGGVRDWQRLDSAGDVKRFLRWVIHSMREHTLSRADAAVFSQIALAMLKALDTSDLETRMDAIERALLEEDRHGSDSNPPTTH